MSLALIPLKWLYCECLLGEVTIALMSLGWSGYTVLTSVSWMKWLLLWCLLSEVTIVLMPLEWSDYCTDASWVKWLYCTHECLFGDYYAYVSWVKWLMYWCLFGEVVILYSCLLGEMAIVLMSLCVKWLYCTRVSSVKWLLYWCHLGEVAILCSCLLREVATVLLSLGWSASPSLPSFWYNRTGWLGVKHQVTYLLTSPPCPLECPWT